MDYERQKRLIYETIFRSNLYKNYTNATPENYFDIGSKFIYWLYSFILKDLLKKTYFNQDEKFFLVQYLCGIVDFIESDYNSVLQKRNGSRIRNTDNIDNFFKYYKKFKNSTDNVAEKYRNTMMHRHSRDA